MAVIDRTYKKVSIAEVFAGATSIGIELRHLTADKDHSIPQVRVANNLKDRISVLVTLGTLTFYSNATAILAVAYDSEGELRWHDENRQTMRINDSKDNERRVSGK